MTQEQKDLLLKDLCARLPYKVKVKDTYYNYDENYQTIWLLDLNAQKVRIFADEGWQSIEYIKPYLFPLSSMTDEQKNSFPFSYSFLEALIDGGVYFDEDECITLNDMIYVIQWCYKNHFDIYGLIPMGLANDATGLNIY